MAKKHRSSRQSGVFQYPATLASGRTWYFRSPEAARRSRIQSWKTARTIERSSQIASKFNEFNGSIEDLNWNYPFYDRLQESEKRFVRWAFHRKIQAGRSGWPDFFCKSPQGGLAAIEVKSGIDTLSPEQLDCFAFLESCGVRVFVFHPKWSAKKDADALVPWRSYVEQSRNADWPGADPGGQAAGQPSTSGQQDLDPKPPHGNPAPEARRILEILGDPELVH